MTTETRNDVTIFLATCEPDGWYYRTRAAAEAAAREMYTQNNEEVPETYDAAEDVQDTGCPTALADMLASGTWDGSARALRGLGYTETWEGRCGATYHHRLERCA